jgi:hypothetical protein
MCRPSEGSWVGAASYDRGSVEEAAFLQVLLQPVKAASRFDSVIQSLVQVWPF